MVNNEFVAEALKSRFEDAGLVFSESYGMLTVEVPADRVTEVIGWLKEHESIRMNYLTDLCGVHYPEQTDRELGVVYHLHSWTNNYRMRIKAFIPQANPVISSATGLYEGANWMERETFDFYGIQFTGHPDLRRILNMDEMDYHPLRKQYALEDETRDDKDDRYFGR